MTLTTATLGDHMAAQGLETREFYNRGARVRKRETAADANSAAVTTEFLAVKVAAPAELVPLAARNPVCRITHRGGHVIEFTEWPEASWLAILLSGVSSPSP